MTQLYTSEEVSRHNREKDLWIVLDNEVYDLTKFLKEHPGGEEVLLQLAGQDGTQCFDDIGHSAEAMQLREVFKIGKLTGGGCDNSASLNGKNKETGSSKRGKPPTEIDDNWQYEVPKYDKSSWFPVLIVIGITIYAIMFYYLFY